MIAKLSGAMLPEKVWNRLRGWFRQSGAASVSPEREAGSRSAFRVMVQKALGDHIRSWRFTILIGIIVLACIGSIYSSITAIKGGSSDGQSGTTFLFLKMFTLSSSTLSLRHSPLSCPGSAADRHFARL